VLVDVLPQVGHRLRRDRPIDVHADRLPLLSIDDQHDPVVLPILEARRGSMSGRGAAGLPTDQRLVESGERRGQLARVGSVPGL
jgi:hypothetical protein